MSEHLFIHINQKRAKYDVKVSREYDINTHAPLRNFIICESCNELHLTAYIVKKKIFGTTSAVKKAARITKVFRQCMSIFQNY
jgi:hypothetical protein